MSSFFSSFRKKKEEKTEEKTKKPQTSIFQTPLTRVVQTFSSSHQVRSNISLPAIQTRTTQQLQLRPDPYLKAVTGNSLDSKPINLNYKSPNPKTVTENTLDSKPINLNYKSPYPETVTGNTLESKPINLNFKSPYSFSNLSPYSRSATSTLSTPSYRGLVLSNPRDQLPAFNQNMGIAKLSGEIKTRKFYDDNKIPTYSTNCKERGQCLIINNIMSKTDKQKRESALIDSKNAKELFTQLGFEVNDHLDLTKKKMEETLKQFIKQSSLKYADISVVIIMSSGYGTSGGAAHIFGIDYEALSTSDILDMFNNNNCKFLADKPKIFIFQCYREDDQQRNFETDVVPFKLPYRHYTDMLVAYSTISDSASFRSPKLGTWYIHAICKVFLEHAHDTDVENLLKIVNQKLVNLGRETGHEQISSYENLRFKKCYLLPMRKF